MPPAQANLDDTTLSATDIITDKKWAASFPQTLSDESNSIKFMIRAMFVAFSCVIRHRKILGDESFKSNYITESLKLRSLSFENKHSLFVAQLLRGASEAIKDSNLEELALVISEKEDSVNVLEVFSWKMHYDSHQNPSAELGIGENGDASFQQLATVQYKGSTSVRDQLVLLVRSVQILCAKQLQPLPEKFEVNFRLKFMPHTRQDYHVDGFKDTTFFYKLPDECQNAHIGVLRPGHHGAMLSCHSVFIADSYATEMYLKRYADRVADSLGYDNPDSLYHSFQSAPSANTSLVVTGTDSTPDLVKPVDEAEKLAAEVKSVSLNQTKTTATPSEKAPGRGRRRKEPTPIVEQKNDNDNASDKKRRGKYPKYGRIRSVSIPSPEKRTRRS